MSRCDTYMNQVDILDTLYTLGQSQGLYRRIYEFLNNMAEEDPDQYEAYMEELEEQHFKDPVDLVMYIEC